MPVWLTLALLVLAVYRLTRLAVRDTFPPVLWLRDRIAGGWRPLTPGELVAPMSVPWRSQQQEIDGVMSRYVVRWKRSPQWLADLASCVWCASGWITGAVTAATALTTSLPNPWLVGPAVWGGAVWLLDRDKAGGHR
jgi:hypothetical protein